MFNYRGMIVGFTVLTVLCSLRVVVAQEFPNLPLKEIENWEQHCDSIMRIVAGRLPWCGKLRPDIPAPEIRTNQNMTPREWAQHAIEDMSEDVRPEAKVVEFFEGRTCNCFFATANIIYVEAHSYLHSVAHEYVHYFQFKYRGDKPEDSYFEYVEEEACRVQFWFAETYLGELRRGKP